MLVADGSANSSNVGSTVTGTATAQFSWRFRETGASANVAIGECTASSAASATYRLPPSAFKHIYVPSAATYTYVFQMAPGSSNTVYCEYVKLVAYEL